MSFVDILICNLSTESFFEKNGLPSAWFGLISPRIGQVPSMRFSYRPFADFRLGVLTAETYCLVFQTTRHQARCSVLWHLPSRAKTRPRAQVKWIPASRHTQYLEADFASN